MKKANLRPRFNVFLDWKNITSVSIQARNTHHILVKNVLTLFLIPRLSTWEMSYCWSVWYTYRKSPKAIAACVWRTLAVYSFFFSPPPRFITKVYLWTRLRWVKSTFPPLSFPYCFRDQLLESQSQITTSKKLFYFLSILLRTMADVERRDSLILPLSLTNNWQLQKERRSCCLTFPIVTCLPVPETHSIRVFFFSLQLSI